MKSCAQSLGEFNQVIKYEHLSRIHSLRSHCQFHDYTTDIQHEIRSLEDVVAESLQNSLRENRGKLTSLHYIGSSYFPTPAWIANKKATINNVNTKDNNCFLYSCLSVSHPYEYVDSEKKMTETCLPAQKHFYSHHAEEDISDDDNAQAIWSKFNIRTMQEYHDL